MTGEIRSDTFPDTASTGARNRPPRRRSALLVVGAAAALIAGGIAGVMVPSPTPAATPVAAPAADSVETGFLQDMIVHHEQAVRMAGVATRSSADPAIRSFAYDILTGQGAQIGRMQAWLDLWDRSRTPTRDYMAWMTAGGGHHDTTAMADGHGGSTGMPGMATEQELTALDAASGPELDVMFVRLMLRHHQGGADMLAYAADRAGSPLVAQFAESMLLLQDHESQVMRALLAERGAAPLPFP
ncbi:DUF305 domain-containing protein [Rhodococcus jostii]|uniref:Uncharacterized conserved protein, DUF305 family n=1 Tax=Rhodococcus jostii TaxID=132919 RepID=A0A1H4IQR1_RHOJO|nr:DUF305 domain-containing protein [Rhodococcus jostii]SEB36006.1 Uncharacterized conserved protein, DUF305 family [Rhodococcus jostii]